MHITFKPNVKACHRLLLLTSVIKFSRLRTCLQTLAIPSLADHVHNAPQTKKIKGRLQKATLNFDTC